MNREGLTGTIASRRVARRTLLTGIAGGAIAAGAGLAQAHPAARRSRLGEYDVIIVGAGFAGVTAARELRAAGKRPLVLEARNRVGGRAYTDTFLGQQVEFGAQWLHPDYKLVHRELSRYGIGTVTDAPTDRCIYPTGDGGYAAMDPADVGRRSGEVLQSLFAASEEYYPRPHEPLHRADLLRRIADVSLRERLDSLGLSASDRSLVVGMLENYSGGDANTGALTSLAQWWALCGFTPDGWAAQSAARPETGMRGLVEAILADAQAEVRMGTTVTEVVDEGSSVLVRTANGAEFTAPAVVMAVPVNVWRTIRFEPELSQAYAEATAEGVGITPAAAKVMVRVTGISDRVSAQGDEGDPVLALIPHVAAPDGGQLMIVGNGPSLDLSSTEAVQEGIRRLVPDVTVHEMQVQDWARDPYSLGGWTMRKPGQLLRQLPAIQQPHGRVAFATADVANGWNAAIEGAVESGFRAARQVGELLSAGGVGG